MADIDNRTATVSLLPLIGTVAAIVATWWFSVTAVAIEAAIDSPYLILGHFAENFPVLAFAVIYGLLHLVVLAFTVTRPFILIRLILILPAAALVLVAALYPSFGGFIARSGFIGGGMMLINAAVSGSIVATLAGGALAGIMLASVIGLARMILDWSYAPKWGRIGRAILALVAFAFMGAVLALGWSTLVAAGARFPNGPLGLVDTVGLIGLMIVAAAPHVLVAALSLATRRALRLSLKR